MNAHEQAVRLRQEILECEKLIELKLQALERLVSEPTLEAESVQEVRETVEGDVLTPITGRQLYSTCSRAGLNLGGNGLHSPTSMTIHPRRLLRICLELQHRRRGLL